ncbi:MAG: hypothetical protein ACO1SX_27610 [Actinomycetota bacterium]
MFRFVSLSVAAFALSALTMGGASAAPKSGASEGMCVAGVGRTVCCKAGVADHCGHVSCCEVGNAAFFSAKSCGAGHAAKTVAHAPAAKAAKAEGHACGSASASCETGNRGFFTASTCGASSKKAGAASACCAAGAKAK